MRAEEQLNNNWAWLGIIVLCLSVLYFLFPSIFRGTVPPVRAAAYTVCASGCDYTTISAASTTVVSGDTLTLSASYANAGEPFPMNVVAGVTINCQSVATIGSTSAVAVTINSTSTIKNCALKNVTVNGGTNVSGITLDNNSRFAGSTSTFSFASGINNFTVTSNTLTSMTLGADGVTSVSGTIRWNTFNPTSSDNSTLTLAGTPSDIRISSNTFSFSPTTIVDDTNFTGITLVGNGIIFSTNTLSFTTSPLRASGMVYIQNAQTITLNGNYLTAPELNTSQASGFYLLASTTVTKINMVNNTIKCPKTSSCVGVYLDDGGVASASISVTSTYNIFYSTSSANFGIDVSKTAAGSTMNLFNDYNGFYTLTSFRNANSNSTFSASSTSRTSDPVFMTSDSSVTNDNYLAPFSPYLDVNSGVDIGAYSAARRSTIVVTPGGTIDYSAVDATSSLSGAGAMITGDTMTLSAGTHVPFSVSSTYATSSLTINGAGVTTIVQGTSYGILLTSVSSSAVSSLVVQGASTTVSTYTGTKMVFTYGGNSYGGNAGLGANVTNIVSAGSCGVSTAITADGQDITSLVNSTTGDWAIVLASFGATRSTFLVPSSIYTSISSPSFLSDCSGNGMTSIDKWVTSTFSRSSGVFTYDSAAVAAAGVTLTGGLGLSTPAVTRTQTTPYGIKLDNSNAITFNSVTSTSNTNGVWFSGTSANNIVSSSVFTSSGSYDIKSDSTGSSNTINNSSFLTASTTITGTGNVNVAFKSRAYVKDSADVVLAGVPVTWLSNSGGITTSLTTDATGYTGYSDHLSAYTMTSSSVAVTNGSFNPYTISAAATSTLSATSTSQNLTTTNQTVTLSMIGIPQIPTSVVTSTVSATSLVFGWTDNSSGNRQETNFITDYVLVGGSFPGTTTTAAQDATSATISGLLPNRFYTFRVAGTNLAGTSAYATSSNNYTLANTPSAPTISATDSASLSLSINVNSNSTSTEFAIYNSTAGTYVAASGASTASAVWQTTSTWGSSVSVTGLTCGTSYSMQVKARNGFGAETSLSTAAAASTNACASTSGGGSVNGQSVISSNNSLMINSGATSTKSASVNLTFSAPNAKYFQVNNSSSFIGSVWVPLINSSVLWQLTSDPGQKIVYARFRDVYENISATINASITLLKVAPVATSPTVVSSTTNALSTSDKASTDVSKNTTVAVSSPTVAKPAVVKVPAPNNVSKGIIVGTVFKRNLSTGMQNKDVTNLQKALKQLKFFTYPKFTEFYGSATRDAVKRFQKAYGVKPVNGVFGPKTRTAMNKLK